MSISLLPAEQRPRERLLAHGASALSEPELVALILRYGVSGRSALDLGADLLTRFGSVAALAEVPAADLARASGLGPAKAASLVAAFQLGRLAEARPDAPVRVGE